MLFSSVFRAFSHVDTRRRLLAGVLLACGLGAGGQAAAAQVFSFDGGKITAGGCTLQGKQYTCDTLPKRQDDDRMTIASGYAVHIKADVVPGWAYGLTMSGSARLTSDGNINLTQMNPPNSSITGGSFDAAGTFSAGPPARITANVSAGTLVLGTGPTFYITGTMVSRGAVTLAYDVTVDGSVSGASVTTNSLARISGAVTASGPIYIGYNSSVGGAVSGSAVTTDAKVVFRSDVTATERFVLESEGSVSGNVTAPDVELRAASSSVTGKVTASKSLVMGSGATVNGEVDTGQLTMQAANALITGNATVDFARLYDQARVRQTIYCKAGTTPGKCDCVDNQSGLAVNSAAGPRCESAKPVSGPLSHFVITHDGSGRTCTPESVTVKACANASCSEAYKNGAQVTLLPEKTAVTIGSSGSQTVSFARASAGRVTLALTQNGATPTTACYNSSSKGASCDIDFTAGMSFAVSVPHHRAGDDNILATIKAVDVDPQSGQCVAALKGQTKDVQYGCSGGAGNLTLKGTALACATGARKAVSSSFDANGEARLALGYQDVGKLTLLAKLDDAEGSATFVVAPYAFAFPALPAAPIRAGDDFQLAVRAVNKSGSVTPGFDKTVLGAGATSTGFALACVAKGSQGQLGADKVEFASGDAKAAMWWGEAGSMNLRATLADFLGSGLDVTGSTGTSSSTACDAKVGPFIPKYFRVEPAAGTPARTWFYYAGEPVPLTVAAMNAKGAVTTNYAGALGLSEAVTLTAFDDAAATQNPGGGKLEAAAVAASAFVGGVASAAPQYWPLGTTPVSVDKLRLRASNGNASASALVTSIDAAGARELARPAVRSGRLRLSNAFGRVGVPVAIKLEAWYWTGAGWLFNNNDDISTLPLGAFTQKRTGKGGAAPDQAVLSGAGKLAAGRASVSLTGNRAGWIDVALNLGGDKAAQPCQPQGYPATVANGAGLPWLRLRSGCLDPSARATFGEQAPENRRMIHMREVFN